MKKLLITLVAIIAIGILIYASWYFFIKKNSEGGSCTNDSRCSQNLKCIEKTCSSGKAGSKCLQKSDCQTDFCVNSRCTEGKISNVCKTYKDCSVGLLCRQSVCAQLPDYSKYFSKVIISKMKTGMPPGQDNPLIETIIFNKTDAIEIDFRGLKPETVGGYYVDFVNATTGEVDVSTKDRMKTEFDGQDTGMGTDLNGFSGGDYDLNIYYKEVLIYSTQITIQ